MENKRSEKKEKNQNCIHRKLGKQTEMQPQAVQDIFHLQNNTSIPPFFFFNWQDLRQTIIII